MQHCSEIGKESVADAAECQEAASELGVDWHGSVVWPHRPKGCFAANDPPSSVNATHWNSHPTGARHDTSFPICRKGGNNNI